MPVTVVLFTVSASGVLPVSLVNKSPETSITLSSVAVAKSATATGGNVELGPLIVRVKVLSSAPSLLAAI